ncbi:hypothetical protein [Aquimarina sp. RZ0]|uniref:hypothetical protein n=1 Tax=Aquimarina sp. RZ0 TaxID=2607730 RepID=UPI0011F19127|nr:hypothetical protein [Aquimarina sp. RZ0]KAA1244524.1 hypothetical protein F0000_16180 [Aquimarina sp. RZ0]
MKCIIHNENNKGGSATIVRRKFVPIKFTIERENQFLNAAAKLPFTTTKVNALLTTSEVQKPCNDTPLPTRYYYGSTPGKMEDTSFLETDTGTVYNTPYPPDGFSNGMRGMWWYYVHPITDRFPVHLENGILETLAAPITVKIKQEGQCTADGYYLWSGILPVTGFSLVTFFPPA